MYKNKDFLSKLVIAALIGTVGLSSLSVEAAETGTSVNSTDTNANNVGEVNYISINSTNAEAGSNYNNDGAVGTDSIAIGNSAMSTKETSVAIGNKSLAAQKADIALGNGAQTMGLWTGLQMPNANNGSAIAIETQARTIKLGGISVGLSAIAGATNSMALGQSAKTDGDYSLAVGYNAKAIAHRATSVGYNAIGNSYGSAAFGHEAKANGYESVSIGRAAASNRIASLALGSDSKANAMGAIALGEYSVASVDSTKLGYNPLTNAVLQSNADIVGLSDADKGKINELSSKVQSLKDTYVAKETEYNNQLTNLNQQISKATQSLTQGTKTEDEKKAIGKTLASLIAERGKLETAIRKARAAYFSSDDFKQYANLVSTWESTSGAVSVGDRDAGITRQITNVAAGTEDTDAVNVAQLKGVVKAMDTNKVSFVEGSNIKIEDVTDTAKGDVGTVYKISGAVAADLTGLSEAGTAAIKKLATDSVKVSSTDTYVKVEANPNTDTAKDYKLSFDYDKLKTNLGTGNDAFITNSILTNAINKAVEGVVAGQATDAHISKLAKESVKVVDGVNTTVTPKDGKDGEPTTYAVNVSNEAIKAAVKPELDSKANVDGSNLKLSNESVTKLKDQLGVTNVSTTVTDVTNRVDGLEASVSNLNENVNSVNNRVNKLDNRVDKVGASAAALAALHPLQFDAADKFTVAAGFGNYQGEQAVALGGFYQANEDLLFSLGGTFGDEKMVNAGVSVRFGEKGDAVKPMAPTAAGELSSKVQALQVKNSELEQTVAAQNSELTAQKEQLAKQAADLEAQRKVIEQLVAKVGLN